VTLDPVVRAALPYCSIEARVGARFLVQLDAAPENSADALICGLCGSLGFDLGVMLAVDRAHSLVIIEVDSHVQKRKNVRQHRMEVDGAMRLAAMQVQRHREDGDLGRDQEIDRKRAPAGLQQAAGEEIEQEADMLAPARAPPPPFGRATQRVD
jgi:hypothetical protein